MLKLGRKKIGDFLNLMSASEDNKFVSDTQTGYINKILFLRSAAFESRFLRLCMNYFV